MTEDPIDAGEFGAWWVAIGAAVAGEAGIDVPCGTCRACCTSSQFVLVEPDDTGARSRIPAALLAPAPGLPAGYDVLGYDEHGHCPMLVDGACSIYEQRPRACRAYDCRIFAAAGIDPGDDKPDISGRVRLWQFHYSDEGARARHDRVRQAAAEIDDAYPTRRALRAIESVRLSQP